MPKGAARPTWLKWLYSSPGCPGAPAFVVTPKLQIYRRRGRPLAIAMAAGIGRTTLKRWKKDAEMRTLPEEAVQAASQGKQADSEAFRQLSPATREALTRYASFTTLAGRCRPRPAPQEEDDAVAIIPSWVGSEQRRADDLKVGQALRGDLDCKRPYEKVKYRRQYGLIEGNLFIIPPDMHAFHKVAVEEWAKRKISGLENLPGFDDWFAAWVSPQERKPRGRRHVVTTTPAAPAQQTNGSGADGHATQQARSVPPELPPAAGQPGRPAKNAELVAYARELKASDPHIRNKEVLKRCRGRFPDHPIFQAEKPGQALRSALYYAGSKDQ
jgi:hypothetical protein